MRSPIRNITQVVGPAATETVDLTIRGRGLRWVLVRASAVDPALPHELRINEGVASPFLSMSVSPFEICSGLPLPAGDLSSEYAYYELTLTNPTAAPVTFTIEGLL